MSTLNCDGSTNASNDSNVTLRRQQSYQRSQDHENDLPLATITSSSLREIIREEMNLALQDTVKGIIHEQFNKINEALSEFKNSLSFFNEKYEEIKIAIEEKSAKILKLEKDNYDLQNSFNNLTKRMNTLEQHSRSSNIELQCIPEYKTENLVTTVLQLSKVVNCDIKDTDIQLCTRIAKKDPQNSRPRSVLVKFNSPRIRDTFLAASMQYNKTNSKNKLNSSHLGIAADKPVPIFVAEHLSPENKALHAATRAKAKELGYRYVWVRNGKIFTKKDETSETVIINDPKKLNSLT